MEWRTPAPKRQPVGFIAPCIPVRSFTPPSGDRWLHEIKHDGYRLIVYRGGRVRLFTRRGYDWSDRYPLIRAAAAALAADATLDGEAVVRDDAGLASFELMHSGEHDQRAILYAFDLLELDGVDQRPLPLLVRKTRLRALVAGAAIGIQFTEHLEGDGATVFAHACKLGCEGIISKDRTRRYRSGVTTHWLKIKNPLAPGTLRFKDP